MKEAMEINVTGIKCDHPECDYVELDVKSEDYPKWVNKPCPKCGSNLLTQADFDSFNQILELATIINNKIGPVPDDIQYVEKATINMDGSGKLNIDMHL